ncbi:MAG: hypothetical protein H7333_02880 [Bdellovibrionales bacterium]|nr:hypothetical protein [Oligoflexia bacterium]
MMMKLEINKIFAIVFALNLLSSAYCHADSAEELKACLKQSLAKESPVYQVPEVSNSVQGNDRYLAMLCDGASAKELYKTLEGAPQEGKWGGKTRGEIKFLGENDGSSMCYHIIRNAEGNSVDQFACTIRLTISQKVLGKTPAFEMGPFK